MGNRFATLRICFEFLFGSGASVGEAMGMILRSRGLVVFVCSVVLSAGLGCVSRPGVPIQKLAIQLPPVSLDGLTELRAFAPV